MIKSRHKYNLLIILALVIIQTVIIMLNDFNIYSPSKSAPLFNEFIRIFPMLLIGLLIGYDFHNYNFKGNFFDKSRFFIVALPLLIIAVIFYANYFVLNIEILSMLSFVLSSYFTIVVTYILITSIAF